MANGTYGVRKPAFITNDDCEIFYYYRPSRSTEATNFSNFKKLNSNNLDTVNVESGITESTMVLPGMYELKLPLDKFGEAGIYTVYIKPKEVYGKILDVSELAAYSNIRGVVIDTLDFTGVTDESIFNNGNLVGYRIEYFDDMMNRTDTYRIITSNNRCEPLSQNFSDSTQSGVKYNFNDSSNLIFCTVSPSTSMSFKTSNKPYIGKKSQKIALVNTKFNPVMLEIEMTEHDIETVSTMLEGAQIRNLNTGTITTFDSNGGIYHQASYGNMANTSNSIHHDFKIPNETSIDFGEENNLETIQNNI